MNLKKRVELMERQSQPEILPPFEIVIVSNKDQAKNTEKYTKVLERENTNELGMITRVYRLE